VSCKGFGRQVAEKKLPHVTAPERVYKISLSFIGGLVIAIEKINK